jgi:hypothetical protein
MQRVLVAPHARRLRARHVAHTSQHSTVPQAPLEGLPGCEHTLAPSCHTPCIRLSARCRNMRTPRSVGVSPACMEAISESGPCSAECSQYGYASSSTPGSALTSSTHAGAG